MDLCITYVERGNCGLVRGTTLECSSETEENHKTGRCPSRDSKQDPPEYRQTHYTLSQFVG
jgi:hypothetical protein